MSRFFLIAALALSSLAACGNDTIPTAAAAELDALAAEKPTALLFSTKGCRYCDIAERGFAGAARELGPAAHVRKVMVGPDNVKLLRARFGLQGGMPDGRLLLKDGRIAKLPLTREGARVAKAIRDAVSAPKLRRSTVAAP